MIPGARRGLVVAAAILAAAIAGPSATLRAQTPPMPVLTEPVTDAAGVIDPSSAAAMDRMIRALEAASGDVVVVAAVPTIAPFADAREYAVKLFANGGRGIGRKGTDNGILVLLAVKEREVRVEVGYDLESVITDGFAGETSRQTMVPFFRQGEYGQGLLAGVQRIIGRIAEARGITLENMPATPVAPPADSGSGSSPPVVLIVLAIWIAISFLRRLLGGGGGRSARRWGGGGWSGWSGGVGGFGGGGSSSGGFGGGFGGFGGGSSGGGGGGASW